MLDYLFDRPGIFQRNKAFLILNTMLWYSHTQSGHLDSYLRHQKQCSIRFELKKTTTLDLFAALCPAISQDLNIHVSFLD